jgi:hypothetical protein
MWVRCLAVALGITIVAGCGHDDPGFVSPGPIVEAIGCHVIAGPFKSPPYDWEECRYNGHRVMVWSFPKDGESTGFMYASRGDGFVLGRRWLVKCWHGEDCLAIQRIIGGKAGISTGHG